MEHESQQLNAGHRKGRNLLGEGSHGETTKDKKFSLEIVSCIGCCDKAPAMIINNKVYGNLTEKKIREIISGLK